MKTIEINKKLYELLLQLIKERRNQDTYCTRNPIYLVQTRVEQVVDPEYEDADIERLYLKSHIDEDCKLPCLEDIKDGYFRESDLPTEVIEALENKNNLSMSDIEDILKSYKLRYSILYYKYHWNTVAYFLSLKEAEDYLNYQSHNLGVTRVYAEYVGYGNRGLFAEILKLLDSDIELIECETDIDDKMKEKYVKKIKNKLKEFYPNVDFRLEKDKEIGKYQISLNNADIAHSDEFYSTLEKLYQEDKELFKKVYFCYEEF